MSISPRFELFVLELNNLLEKHMLKLDDRVYFVYEGEHYELEQMENCFSLYCFETSEEKKYYTDKIYNVDTDGIVEEEYPDDEDDYLEII